MELGLGECGEVRQEKETSLAQERGVALTSESFG